MSLSLALKTELTCIPKLMHELLGRNFNNPLCNHVTWLCAFWFIVYSCYQKLIDTSLKRLGFAVYQRTRLTSSLWNLALYASFLTFYWLKDHMENSAKLKENAGTDLQVTAYAVLCSFYLFMGYKQGVQENCFRSFLTIEAFALACFLAYMLGLVGVFFTLTAVVVVSGIFVELTRTSYTLLNKSSKVAKLFLLGLFVWTLLIFTMTHFIAVPLAFMLPLGLQLLSGKLELIPLLLVLLAWLGLTGYKSILHNLIVHWANHVKLKSDKSEVSDSEEEVQPAKNLDSGCLGTVLECSLFPPRQDDAYILSVYRSEVKDRQQQMIKRRKPKSKNMIIQTLKCMMAIKKKLSEKKASQTASADRLDLSQSDEESDVDSDSSEEVSAIRRSDKIFDLSSETPSAHTVNEEKEESETKEEEVVEVVDYLFENPVKASESVTVEEYECPEETSVDAFAESEASGGHCEGEAVPDNVSEQNENDSIDNSDLPT